MPNQPQRRVNKLVHLDASVEHVERALLARAEDLENLALSARGAYAAIGEEVLVKENLTHETASAIAAEFRLLAEELHWWLFGTTWCRSVCTVIY